MAAAALSRLAGEHATAASIIDRVLALNPNSAHAWVASGFVCCYRNLPDPAIVVFQHAMRLSPLDPFGYVLTGGLAFAHSEAGRYAEAIEWADRSLREQPRSAAAMRIKVASCAHLGRTAEAREWLRRLLELQPGLTIAKYKALATVFLPPEKVGLYVEGLRKAGLPEE